MPTYNLVTDFGAVSGGSTAVNTQAFLDFRTAAQLQTELVTLIIPAGTYALGSENNASARPFDGIRELIVEGTGATLNFTAAFVANGLMKCGAWGSFSQAAATTARVYSVAQASLAAVCKTPAHASRFPVGRWACLGALELQGEGGYPPNLHYFQFVKITETNPVTGLVKFTPPAKQNYSSSFPPTSAAAGAYDSGGPATLFLMKGSNQSSDTAFDCNHEYRGLTFFQTNTPPAGYQFMTQGRTTKFVNCTFTGAAFSPTVGVHHRFEGCTFNDAQIEVDKTIELLEFDNCTFAGMIVQSSSVHQLTISNSTFTAPLRGTARHTTLINTTIPIFRHGPQGYGNSETLTIQGCTISVYEDYTINNYLNSQLTFSNGNITLSGVGDIGRYFLPGALLVCSGSSRASGRFTSWATGWSYSAPGDYPPAIVNTNYPEPMQFPTDAAVGAPQRMLQHPMPSISVANSTGCPEIVDFAFPESQNKPVWSFSRRTGTFENAVFSQTWGKFVHLKITVMTPYTGAQAQCRLQYTGSVVLNTAGAPIPGTHLFAEINCKIAGVRVITPASVSGAQTGDSFPSPPGDIWYTGGSQVEIADNISGDSPAQKPSITVEVLTNQLPAVALVYDPLNDLPPFNVLPTPLPIPSWPFGLPHEPVLGSWQIESLHIPPLATDMEGGNTRQRRRPGSNVARVNQTIRMTRDELAAFKLFMRDILSGGTSRFALTVWLGDECATKECQFSAQPTIVAISQKYFMVSMQLRVYGM